MNRRLRCVALCAGVQLAGCAAVFTLSSDRVDGWMYEDRKLLQTLPRLYSGVLFDGWCITHAGQAAEAFWMCLLDLPLSLAVDTVVLPYKAYKQIEYGNFHPRFVPDVHESFERNREANRQQHIRMCRAAVASDGGWWADHPQARERCRKDLEAEETDGGTGPGEYREQ
jgi:uncharacterized protein YceK